MATIKVVDMNGNDKGELTLNDSVFAAPVNESVLHSAVVAFLANQRQGTQSTLTRAEVRGGGRKPWRQKGTGRARQGSIRSPQWTHGGVAFGPKPRSYKVTLNKKVKKVAMRSALSQKFLDGSIIVVDSISFDEIKTKNVVGMLKSIGAEGKTLIVNDKADCNVITSARNIPNVITTVAGIMNVYDIINADKFVVSSDAVKMIEEVYAV